MLTPDVYWAGRGQEADPHTGLGKAVGPAGGGSHETLAVVNK